jgi:hypothetical protein
MESHLPDLSGTLGFDGGIPVQFPMATRILFVCKYPERIADHTTNIVEIMLFLVKGRDIRHMNKRRKDIEVPQSNKPWKRLSRGPCRQWLEGSID